MRFVLCLLIASSASTSLMALQRKKKPKPPITPHNNVFLSGDFLYFKPDQTGMTYCLKSDTVPTAGLMTGDQTEVSPKSNWRPGYRVGGGFSFLKAKAALSSYWTHYHHTMHAFLTAPYLFEGQVGGTIVGGTAVPGAAGSFATSAWKLHFDQIELDLSYQLHFHHYRLIPYFGVQAGKLHQKQSLLYSNFLDELSTANLTVTVNQTNRFRGIGPKFGIKAELCFGGGVGIMGNLAGFFLYGSMHAPVNVAVVGDAGSFSPAVYTVHYRKHQVMPAMQAQLELNWQRQFTKRCNLLIGVGCEVQYFWNTWRNQNSSFQNLFVADAGYGNLSLQGGTARIVLGF